MASRRLYLHVPQGFLREALSEAKQRIFCKASGSLISGSTLSSCALLGGAVSLATFSLALGCSKAQRSPFLHCPLRKNRQTSAFFPSIDYYFLDSISQYQVSMEQTPSHRHLDFSYRHYLQCGEGIPNGTEIGEYTVLKEIGKGAFGKIYLAKDRKGTDYAFKLMDLEKIKKQSNPRIQEIRWRLVRNQPALMQLCNSPNVLRCWDIFQNESLKALVLEYCNGHTLQQYLDRKGRIGQQEAVRILRQVINGVAELHRHSIIHRDLKADNIMEHEGQYKIIDLGFSKKLEITHEQAEVKGTILGTVTTMAPEVLSKQSYGLKADIWSLGVIFFQMVFGTLLYDSVSAYKRLQEIQQKRYFSPDKELTFNKITISADANNFLFRALQVNTEKRMGWRELLEHPLIKEKEEEPIGDRFLLRNSLEMPEVDHDLKLEPTIRITAKNEDERLNNEDAELISRFNPSANEEDSDSDERFKEEQQPHPIIEKEEKKEAIIQKIQPPKPKEDTQKKKPQVKKNGFKIDYTSDKQKKASQNNIPPERQNINNKPPFQGLPVPVASSVIRQNNYQKKQDSAEFKWVKNAHLQCLKTQLFYHQILLPIQIKKILDLDDRDVIQFMFLVAARCFQNVSPISLQVENNPKVNPIVRNLHEQVRSLYQKVREKFQTYSQRLTQVQNKFFQIFLDFFRKRFLKSDYEEKSSFTAGIQISQLAPENSLYGDYSKREQINYTYNNYVGNMLKKLTENKRSDQAVIEKVSGYLRYYDRIGMLTLEDLDGENFGEYVRRIVA